MDDHLRESESANKASAKGPERQITRRVAIEDARFVLDRIVVIGWLITTVLALTTSISGFTVATIWITYTTVILSVFDVVLYFHWHTSVSAYLVLVGVVAIGCIISLHWQQALIENQREGRETETHFWLVPANDPTPYSSCAGIIPKGDLSVIFGGNVMWSSRKAFAAVRIGTCTTLKVERSEAGLAITGDIYGPNDKLIARVIHNEFHLVPSQMSYPEKSDDRSTLTIYDPQGEEALYVRYINARTLEIRGKFFCSGWSVLAKHDSTETVVNDRPAHIGTNCVGSPPLIFTQRGVGM